MLPISLAPPEETGLERWTISIGGVVIPKPRYRRGRMALTIDEILADPVLNRQYLIREHVSDRVTTRCHIYMGTWIPWSYGGWRKGNGKGNMRGLYEAGKLPYTQIKDPATGKQETGHQFMWKRANGPIPHVGWVVHHRCLCKLCINAEHLRCVSQADNVLFAQQEQTHCRNGHPFSVYAGYESRVYKDGSRLDGAARYCKKCREESRERQRLADKERRRKAREERDG